MRAHSFTLADDDPNDLFPLHCMLIRLYPDSNISMFSNAENALTHILSTGTDILITDHGMGEMSGTELIRELRLRKWEIPIIMISGSPTAEQEAMAAGATKFVSKHASSRVLEAHIRALVEVSKPFKHQGTHHPPLKRHSRRPHPARRAAR